MSGSEDRRIGVCRPLHAFVCGKGGGEGEHVCARVHACARGLILLHLDQTNTAATDPVSVSKFYN